MPNPKGVSNKEAYKRWHSSPLSIKKRSNRNKARRTMAKEGKVTKGDGKHVDHKNGNPLTNKRSNLQILSAKENRKKQ